MFKLLRMKNVQGSDLLTSQLFDEATFYKAFINDLRSATKSVVIESPYLTEKRAVQFSKLFKNLKKRDVSVRINTRNPRHHDKTLEIQAWRAMKILRANGVKVYICSDMRHRKLAVIDDCILWDGSLNILSQAHSKEIMRRTNSVTLCSQMVAFTRLKSWCW
jgi:phosphatidylserine/phosphatidylglycerophosphate/cardiolipin synthase-like enzyme